MTLNNVDRAEPNHSLARYIPGLDRQSMTEHDGRDEDDVEERDEQCGISHVFPFHNRPLVLGSRCAHVRL